MTLPQNSFLFFLQADFLKYPATQGRDSGSGELDVTGTCMKEGLFNTHWEQLT